MLGFDPHPILVAAGAVAIIVPTLAVVALLGVVAVGLLHLRFGEEEPQTSYDHGTKSDIGPPP